MSNNACIDAVAVSPLDSRDVEIQRLASYIEERLNELGDEAFEAKRKLVALLLASDKKKASERLAARARRFAQQGGRCAACGQMFATTKGVASRHDDAEPLLCVKCRRAKTLKQAIAAAGRTESSSR